MSRMTYMRSWKSLRLPSHTWLGLNPQIGRPLSRIVVPLVYFLFKSQLNKTTIKWLARSVVTFTGIKLTPSSCRLCLIFGKVKSIVISI
jgi:hypothetical protein